MRLGSLLIVIALICGNVWLAAAADSGPAQSAAPDIRDIQTAPEPRLASPRFAAALTLALLSGALAAGIALKKKSIPRPPDEAALEKLEALRRKTPGLVDYYTELSDIVRTYLEGTCGIEPAARTTEEFLEAIAGKEPLCNLPAGQEELVRNLMTRCDLVKFAGLKLSPDENDADYETARAVIAMMGKEALANDLP